jgi:hypothetical protein
MPLARAKLVAVLGHLAMVADFPELRYMGCEGRGMAGQFSRAAAGDELAIDRCVITCLYCPSKLQCREFALTKLTESQREQLGVVGGIVAVLPKAPA